MLVLAGVGNVAEARDQLTRWLEDGGVLVRFAGPRLAAADDDLIPVKLRRGGRTPAAPPSLGQAPQNTTLSPHDPLLYLEGAHDRTAPPPRPCAPSPPHSLTDLPPPP